MVVGTKLRTTGNSNEIPATNEKVEYQKEVTHQHDLASTSLLYQHPQGVRCRTNQHQPTIGSAFS